MLVVLDKDGKLNRTVTQTRSEAYTMLGDYTFFPLQCVCIRESSIYIRVKEEERGVLREGYI